MKLKQVPLWGWALGAVGVAGGGFAYWNSAWPRGLRVFPKGSDNLNDLIAEEVHPTWLAARKAREEWLQKSEGRGWRVEMLDLPKGTTSMAQLVTQANGLGNAPAQVQEWGKRGMHLGPYHESSTHGDSPFLFGPEHYHQITEPGRTQKDYLTGPERMSAEAWKDGRKSWVDITPQGGPKMRVTHQIFGGERGAGY